MPGSVVIEFLLRAFTLKDQERIGWVMRNVSSPESVADHSWGTALLCLLYGAEAGIAVPRAMKIALVHDLAEAEIGDIAARANEADREVSLSEKARLERLAIDSLLRGLQGTELLELWQEYELASTPEAMFVRDMNLVDMCLQALKYEVERRYDNTVRNEVVRDYERLDEYFLSAGQRIATDTGKRLFGEIESRYEAEKTQNH